QNTFARKNEVERHPRCKLLANLSLCHFAAKLKARCFAFDFVAQLQCRNSGVVYPRIEKALQLWILGLWRKKFGGNLSKFLCGERIVLLSSCNLAKHFEKVVIAHALAEHVDDPGALLIHDGPPRIARLRRA